MRQPLRCFSNDIPVGFQLSDQYRKRRVVWAIIIRADNHQIFPEVQAFQKLQQILLFLKTGIPSAVNAKAHETARFQQT